MNRFVFVSALLLLSLPSHTRAGDFITNHSTSIPDKVTWKTLPSIPPNQKITADDWNLYVKAPLLDTRQAIWDLQTSQGNTSTRVTNNENAVADLQRSVSSLNDTAGTPAIDNRLETSGTVALTLTSQEVQRFVNQPTSNISVSLPSPGAQRKAFRVMRSIAGNYGIDVAGLVTIPSGSAGWADVVYDAAGATWVVTGYGTFAAPPPPTVVSAPTFSPPGGAYSSAQNVSLTSTTSGASIYYTLDGSTPVPGGSGASTLSISTAPVDTADSATTSTVTYASANWAAGDLIVCTVRHVGNSSITASTVAGGTGLTWAKAAGGQDTGYGMCQAWYAEAPSTQSGQSLTWTLAPSTLAANGKGMACYKFINARDGTPIGATAVKSNYANEPLAVSITPQSTGSIIVVTGAQATNQTAPTYIASGEGSTTQDGAVNASGHSVWSAHTAATTTTTARTIGTTAPLLTNSSGATLTCAWEIRAGASTSLYSAPLNIDSTTTVRAIAAKSGMTNSSVASATYTLNAGSGTGTGGTFGASYVTVSGAGTMPSLAGLPTADSCQGVAAGSAMTTCLQGVLDSAATNGKEAVVINGPYTYQTDGTLFSRVGLIGQGSTQPIIYRSTSTYPEAIIMYKGFRGVTGVSPGPINNIWVYNLHLKGNYTGCNGTYEGTLSACDQSHEGQQAIMLGSGSNYTIKGNYIELPSADCIGDGRQPDDDSHGYGDIHNVLVDGNTCVNPYRVTIALTGSSANWLITNNVLSKTTGQVNWPIDIEPNNNARRVNDIEIGHNTITSGHPSSGEQGTAVSTGFGGACGSGCPGNPSRLFMHDNHGSWNSTAGSCNGFWVVHASDPVAWTQVLCDTTNSIGETGGGTAVASGVSYVNSIPASQVSSAATYNSASFSATAGNLILVGVSTAAANVTSVTDSAGNTYSKIATATTGNWALSNVWATKATASSATNVVTINLSAAAVTRFGIAQYSGASSAAPKIASFSRNGSGATSLTSSAFSPTAGDAIIVYTTMGTDQTTFTGAAGYVLRNTGTVWSSWEDRLTTAGGAQNTSISWALANAYADMWVLTFK